MPRKLSNTYSAIHQWVRNNFGYPMMCELCHKDKPDPKRKRTFSWSNNGVLNRERKNWRTLCYPCHKTFDLTRNGYVAWNKGNKKKRPELICEWCGLKFIPKRFRQVLCGRKCTAHRNGNIKKRHLIEKGIVKP